MKYSIRTLKAAIENPRRAAREINRIYNRTMLNSNYNPRGTNLLDEDWDNLIILDACRADLFREVSTLPGKTESRTSLASATYEWVPATFSGRVLHDTVYVTINSHYTRLRDEISSEVHSLIDVQQMDLPADQYDDLFDIPHPEVVTEHALRAASDFPKKRLIVHHNVPHYPYLSEFGRERFPIPSSSLTDAVNEADGKNISKAILEAYRDNVRIGIQEVARFYDQVNGKTVVTADHGEMLGERHRFLPVRDWGHPAEIYNCYLTEVPWHILPYDSRKKITAEAPSGEYIATKEGTKENLKRLGYL